jgi:hypothetical protein
MRADARGATCIRASQAKPGLWMLITCSAVNGRQRSRRFARISPQPHGIRSRIFAHRTLRKGLDDRWNRRRRQFDHARMFETGDHRVRPPAEDSRGQQVSQQQTSRTGKRQDLQTRPDADEVQFRSHRRFPPRRTSQRVSSPSRPPDQFGHDCSFSPGQKQAEVAWHSAWEVEDTGGKPKTVRL